MASIAARCHELRVNDEGRVWRLMYRLDADAMLILAVFARKLKRRLTRSFEFVEKD